MNNLSTFYSGKNNDKESATRLLKKLRIALLVWLLAAVMFVAWYFIWPV